MDNEELEEVVKEKRYSGKVKAVIVFLLMFVILIITFIINRKKGSDTYDTMSIVSYAEWDSSGMISYISYRNGIIKISRDGAQAISSSGKSIWNVAYNMKKPVGEVCGEYCVIADCGQKQLCIIGPDGTANQLTLPYAISDISIARQGVVAVLTNAGTEDYIYLFGMNSKDGTSPLCEIKTVVESSGFPIEVKISGDGKKLATAYMKVDNDEISNWITFYNFGDVGQNWIDNIVGSYNSGSAFVPEILMLKNNMVVVCKDNGFYVYKVDEVPETKAIKEFTDKEVKSITANESYICTVLKNTSGDNRYTYVVCNADGSVRKEFQAGEEFDGILIHGSDIMVYSSSDFTIYSIDGEKKYSGTFERNVDKIFAGNSEGCFTITGNGYIEVVEFTKTK